MINKRLEFQACTRSVYNRSDSGDRGYIKLGGEIIYFIHGVIADNQVESTSVAELVIDSDSVIELEPDNEVDQCAPGARQPALLPDQRPNVHVF